MPSGSLGTALKNPLECLRKGFERPLNGLWDAFGTLLEALGRPRGVFGASGASGTVFEGVLLICVPPLGGPWEAMGDPLGRFWST